MLAPMLVQMERQIDREIAADNKANGVVSSTQTETQMTSTGIETEEFDSDSEEEDDDNGPMLMYGPQPQIVTNDLKSLDEMVSKFFMFSIFSPCGFVKQFSILLFSDDHKTKRSNVKREDHKIILWVCLMKNFISKEWRFKVLNWNRSLFSVSFRVDWTRVFGKSFFKLFVLILCNECWNFIRKWCQHFPSIKQKSVEDKSAISLYFSKTNDATAHVEHQLICYVFISRCAFFLLACIIAFIHSFFHKNKANIQLCLDLNGVSGKPTMLNLSLQASCRSCVDGVIYSLALFTIGIWISLVFPSPFILYRP